MLIEKKLLEKWKRLRSPDDARKMAEKIEGGYPELCNDAVFKVMAEYYDEKAELVKQYL
jgi:hypothetical protein